jgi:hypothetical protein
MQDSIVAEVAGKVLPMNSLRLWLQGKKTYVVAIGSIVAVIVAWVQGTTDTKTAVEMVVPLILAICLRSGISSDATP